MDPQQPNSDDTDLHNVSTDSNAPSGKPDKMLGESDFISLLGTRDESYYIDKTNLVEVFLNGGRKRVLASGPRRFGKTTNLFMLKAFFESQVPAEESKTLSEEELQIRIKETDNYKLFQEHQLVITKNSDLMKKHFGKYPVLHISFRCEAIANLYDVLDFFKITISDAFRAHSYLLHSKALHSWEKDECSKWCNKEWDAEKNKYEILNGLKNLATYLYKHFNKKIVLLIDEYDSVVIRAILKLKANDELENVIEFCTGIIQAAVKNDINLHIEYAFITGISHIAGMGLSGSNIKPYRFLENHSYVPYYGLTDTEVQQLLQTTYGFNQQRIDEVEKKFNGYSTVGGVKIYNIWSVLEYASKVKEDDFTYEWQDTGYIVGLQKAFRFPIILQTIQTQLLLNKPIKIKKLKTLKVEDVLKLVNIIGNVHPQNVGDSHFNIFFSFILDQGYLSFVAKKPDLLVIPNEQIKEQFKEKITEFNNEVFDKDTTSIEKCRDFFLKISKTQCDHDDFKEFQMNLETVLQKYAATWLKKNEENIRCILKMLISDLGFKDCAELVFKFEEDGQKCTRKIDCLFVIDDFLMIFETKYKASNRSAMLFIKKRKYLKVLDAKDIIRNPITRYVLMGINMDENRQVSIGYLQNNQNFEAMTLIP